MATISEKEEVFPCPQAADEGEGKVKALDRGVGDWNAETRTPSEASSGCTFEEDEDCSLPEDCSCSLPAIEALEEQDDSLPTTPQPRINRHNTADLTQEVPSLLERMNEASSRVNVLEREAGDAVARYRRRVLRYEQIYRGMRAEHGDAFDKCKPLCKDPRSLEVLRAQLGNTTVEELKRCYRTLERHQASLTKEHQLMDRLSQKVRAAKRRYTSTMSELEGISNQVHQMRLNR